MTLALAAVCVVLSGGCGNAHVRAPSPSPVVSTNDAGLLESGHWASPVVSGDGTGGYIARLSSASGADSNLQPRSVGVRLTGIGYPDRGSAEGRTFVGPGVDAQFTQQTGQYGVSLGFSGVRLSLLVWSTGGDWRVKVDGKYIGSAPTSAGSAYGYHTLNLDFAKAGGARRRTVQFDLAGGVWLAGLSVGRDTDRVWLPPRPASPSVYWLGDSYVAGGGATFPGFDDLAHVASARAGLGDVTVDALGGTGYVKDNPAAKFPNFLARAKLNLGSGRARPDLVVVGGSINDAGASRQQVRAAAAALYAYLAKALPRAKVIVAPFTSVYPVPAPIETTIEGVLDAAHAAPNVVGALDLPAQVLELSARHRVPRLAMLESTKTLYHPSPAGHELYGQLIGDLIMRLEKRGRIRSA